MLEVIILSILALIWIIFATIQDIKIREVANWLNFSLIIFALGFRFFFSLFTQTNMMFFYQGLIGLGIFFILGNLFYYARMFAGGDAKLFISLGAILPLSTSFQTNLQYLVLFFAIFLIIGAFYGFIFSIVLTITNFKIFKKEFSKKLKQYKIIASLTMFFGLIILLLGLIQTIFLLAGIFIFLLPIFLIYAKSIDEACMIKRIKTKYLREGDWLHKNIKIKNQIIQAKWEGLNQKQINLIQKNQKEIKIKQGIPFVPAFLISFILFLVFYFLGYSLW